jgi:hypothetical protein
VSEVRLVIQHRCVLQVLMAHTSIYADDFTAAAQVLLHRV